MANNQGKKKQRILDLLKNPNSAYLWGSMKKTGGRKRGRIKGNRSAYNV
jgi:hypothetical protein